MTSENTELPVSPIRHRKLNNLFREKVSFMCGEASRKSMEEDPNNGKPGWWKVHGLRHCALVHANSALEAVDKAGKAGAVHDWEGACAQFLAQELPDVVEMP